MQPIERRSFGNTGLTVSALGLGCGQLGSANLLEADARQLIDTALEQGITLFDTARGYGLSEERLGRYLGARRKDVVLSTKVGYGVAGTPDWTYSAIATGVDDALRVLRTDVIDIVHLHSCSLEILQQGEVITALEDARQAGKLRVAAYSGENEKLAYAIECGRFQSVQTSISIADQHNLAGLLPEAAAHRLGVIAKRPVANAPWRFKTRPYGHYSEEYWYRWQTIALNPRGLDWQELALRWVGYLPGVHSLIAGTASLDHLRRNAELLARGPLPPAQFEEIREAFLRHDDDWMGLT